MHISTVLFLLLKLFLDRELPGRVANSEFVVLLKQANTDSSRMAEVIGVSEAQLRFGTNTSSGMGLMKCGNIIRRRKNSAGCWK
jgi:hypothetical protein